MRLLLKILAYIVGGILYFLFAEGLVYLYTHAWSKTLHWWTFPLALLISPFIFAVICILFIIAVALFFYIVTMIDERHKLQKNEE